MKRHILLALSALVVMVMPVLYAGMLLGGISPLTGLLALLLLIASAFVANVLAGVIALVMADKKKQ